MVSDERRHSSPSPPIVLIRLLTVSAVFAEQSWTASPDTQCDAYVCYERLTEVARPHDPRRSCTAAAI